MAAPPCAPAHLVTTTALLDPLCDGDQTCGMAIDAEGTLYYTTSSARCVFKSHRQWGRHAPSVVLAGDPRAAGEEEGAAYNARFNRPGGVCINPLDPRSLLVMDGQRMWAVDVVSGDVSSLTIKGHRPLDLLSCAWGGGSHIWMEDGAKLLRLDMRSMVAEVVIPAQTGCRRVLCVDHTGSAIGRSRGGSQLLRVQPDGTTTLLAGTAEAGFRDGRAAEAQFGSPLCAAAAGDGSIVVADADNRRLRLVSPDGVVSTLAGSGEEGQKNGRLLQASFTYLDAVVVSPWGDVLALALEPAQDNDTWRALLRTVPARLQPPAHLAPAPPPPHPVLAMSDSLLRSALLSDLTIRVVAGQGDSEGRQRLHVAQQAAAGGTARCGGDGSGSVDAASQQARPSSGDSSRAAAAAEVVDIPCHRNVMASSSPYFRALCVGVLAQQRATAVLPAATGSTAGRKRKAAGGAGGSGAGSGAAADTAAGTSAATAPEAASPTPVVVAVDDASVDAVQAVLRHVYTGSLDGVTASTAQDVLHLAQLWGLDGLLEACQAFVAEQLLGPGNAAEWLVCAEGRQYGAIRAAALRAVVEHFEEVRADPAQLALLTAHPMLLVEAMALSCTAKGAGGSK